MKIYVGNLPDDANEEELRRAFSAFGEVSSVNITNVLGSEWKKGFAFVEMPSTVGGQAAVDALNKKILKGRMLRVNLARLPGTNRGRQPVVL